MFDLWIRDTEITTLLLGFALLVVLPGQLLLCFKAKKLRWKLLPACFFTAVSAAFFALMRTAKDWSAVGYAILFAFSLVMFLLCGAAWVIWTLIRYRQKKKSHRSAHS